MCLTSTLSVTLFLVSHVKSCRAVLSAIVRPGQTTAEVSRLPEKADPIRSSALTVRSSNRSQRFCVIRYHQTLQFHQRRETS
jgi:hypothetical protein